MRDVGRVTKTAGNSLSRKTGFAEKKRSSIIGASKRMSNKVIHMNDLQAVYSGQQSSG